MRPKLQIQFLSTVATLIGVFAGLPYAQAADSGEREAARAATAASARLYPGGRDEEDLKVQETLPTPGLNVDRRTIEQKVLNSYFKKPTATPDSNSKTE